MTPEEQRAAMHRAVDQICDAQTHAQLDAKARCYSTGEGGTSKGGHADPTYGASLRANIADVWIAKTLQTQKDLYHQADMALKHWPAPPGKGANVNGTTIGDRNNTTELCALCQIPVLGGRDDPIRRIDGQPYHAKTCWWTVHRQRQTKAG